jgi:adenylylsulfate kinase
MRGWAVWFVGLPGSGKSSISKRVYEYLRDKGLSVVYLQMDERRKVYFPEPEYTPEERQKAYELFAQEGAEWAAKGYGVILDGTAYKVEMRHLARKKIDKFAEIYVACSLETAMERESKRPEGLVMAGLYAKAMERKKTGRQFPGLGQVIGVDIPFEEDPHAELVVKNEGISLDEAVKQVIDFLEKWLPEDGRRQYGTGNSN